MDRNPLLCPEGCFPSDRAVDRSLLLVSRLSINGGDNVRNQRERGVRIKTRKPEKEREGEETRGKDSFSREEEEREAHEWYTDGVLVL